LKQIYEDHVFSAEEGFGALPHSRRVTQLLRRAERFLDDAKRAMSDEYYDLAIFYAEQAAQLALKALILYTTGSYPEIHGLRMLLGEYYKATGDEEAVEIVKRLRRLLTMLERAYTEARYGSEEYSEEEAMDAVSVAEELLGFAKKRISLGTE
jgi:HEPN domain-containing protein